jgi:hypothetical protein
MQELSMIEQEEVGGGVVINPWTVMIGVRAAQVYGPSVIRGAVAAAGVVAGWLSVE